MSSITTITMQRGCALVDIAEIRFVDSWADLSQAQYELFIDGHSHDAIDAMTATWEALVRLSERVFMRLDSRFPQHGPTLDDLGPVHGPFGSAADEPF